MAVVGPLTEEALPEADRIFRLAFGTFLAVPDPTQTFGDTDWVATRWRTDRDGAFGATQDGVLVGSNFATRWGSFGFFGPLSVRPDLWDKGVARALLDATMACFEASGTAHVGLFTFPNSPKHVALYQRYGFWPRFLTAVMGTGTTTGPAPAGTTVLSSTPPAARAAWLADCRSVSDAVLPGMDATREIEGVARQGIGETIAIDDGSRIAAFAILHAGAGSEAGSASAYVKHAAVRPGPHAAAVFDRLLDACRQVAGTRGATAVVAGVNLAHEEAFGRMRARGFTTGLLGVAMHRHNDPIYHRPGLWVLDDWR